MPEIPEVVTWYEPRVHFKPIPVHTPSIASSALQTPHLTNVETGQKRRKEGKRTRTHPPKLGNPAIHTYPPTFLIPSLRRNCVNPPPAEWPTSTTSSGISLTLFPLLSASRSCTNPRPTRRSPANADLGYPQTIRKNDGFQLAPWPRTERA